MIFLARFISAGPSQAALVAAACAILAIILPPMAWVSGGAIALTVLHLGPVRGLQLMVFAGLALMMLSWLAIGTPLLVFSIVLLLWMPVWLASVVLYRSVSLALALQMISLMGLLFVLLMQLVYPELMILLSQEFADVLQPMIDQQTVQQDKDDLIAAMNSVFSLLPSLLAMGMIMGAVLSLLLGRWWQAALYNPGGLSAEFNELRLGKPASVIALLLGVLALMSRDLLAVMLALTLMPLFLIQGLALIHSVIAIKQIRKIWLAGLYISIFSIPQLVMIPLVVVGLTDAWLDYRRRLKTN